MSARTAYAAATEFGGTLARAFACVTSQPFHLLPSPAGSSLYSFTSMPRNHAIQLQSDTFPEPLRLSIRIELAIEQPESRERHFIATICAYSIVLRLQNEAELFAYHWHPNSLSNVPFPHLHVGERFASLHLKKVHLPTGIVEMNAIVRMLIADCGVAPLRPDWQTVLF